MIVREDSGAMPRIPRFLLPKTYYHIMTRGNNKHTIFIEDEDFVFYLEILKKYKHELPFELYHYCLMPNHTHFLVKIPNPLAFAKLMQKINLVYSHYYRKKYSWVGHFWQNRYKSKPVGKDSYFIQCGKYIELNPVRSRIATSAELYRYSSARYYCLGEANDLITEDPFFSSLGDTIEKRYKEYSLLNISATVLESYGAEIWGSRKEHNNEQSKLRYHRKNAA